MSEIWVSGSPSFVGGADTELYHQIVLWRKHGIDIFIVPTSSPDPRMKTRAQRLGCKYRTYRPGLFKDKLVVSFCNGEALKRLLNDDAGQPRAFVWFNCMTWTTTQEIEAIKRGLITHLGFASNYQRDKLLVEYSKSIPEMCRNGQVSAGHKSFPRIIDYSPWLDILEFKVVEKRGDYFGVGRISRADPAKFSTDCWRIFDRVLTPSWKKVFILGYSENVQKVVGPPPENLDWKWWTPGAISSTEFYSMIDVMIHKTGGSRESYCRVFVEAMAHGVIPLVEYAYAFPELLEKAGDLKDFLLCKTSDEMSYKASQLAFYPKMLAEYKKACRRYAENVFTRDKPFIAAWRKLLNES